MPERGVGAQGTLRDAQTLSEIGRQKAAIALLVNALDADAADPRLCTAMAVAQLRAGRFGPALAFARRALMTSPDDGTARRVVVVALLEAGRAEEALREAHAALDGGGGSVDALCDLAIAALASGNRDCARSQAEAAAALAPASARAHRTLGLVELREGRWLQAEAANRRALQLGQGELEAANNLAIALALQGHADEAGGFFRQAHVRSEVTRHHATVVANRSLHDGFQWRMSARGRETLFFSGQVRVLLFLLMVVLVLFLRSVYFVPVVLVSGALVLNAAVAGRGGRRRARAFTALPAFARVTVPRP